MKKAISLVLAVALVLALLPSFALASDATVESYTYNFKTGLHATGSNIPACTTWSSTDSGEGEWTGLGSGLGYGSTGVTAWQGTYRSNGIDYFVYKPYVKAPEIMPTYSPGVALDDDTQFFVAQTVKIEVKKAGTFTPSITLTSVTNSPKWEVFLTEEAPSDVYRAWVEGFDSSDRLGVIDGYGTGADVTETFLNRTLEAGSYYLTLVANGVNPSCEFVEYVDTKNNRTLYYAFLYWKSFALKNIAEEPDSFAYNTTSSALADPSTASNYAFSGSWDGSAIRMSSSALGDNTDKFSVHGTRYCYGANISENGLQFNVYKSRYAEYTGNTEFAYDEETKTWGPAPNKSNVYGSAAHAALILNVPVEGKYKLYLTNASDADYGVSSNVFFAQYPNRSWSYSLNEQFLNPTFGYKLENRHFSNVEHTAQNKEYIGEIVVTAPGEYYLLFAPDGISAAESVGTYKIGTQSNLQNITLSGIYLEPIPEEPDPEFVAAQNNFNTIKATKTNEIAAAKNEGLSETAFVNVLNTSIDGSFSELEGKIVATRGEDVTVKADSWSGYDFLYWRQGLGADAKVIASSTECTVKAAPGTWLTAVYKPAPSTDVSVLFYNADGDIVSKSLVANGETITLPSAPTAPKGCGEFLGWALNTPDNIVTEATAGGKSMVFVAQFAASTEKNIAVTVNGGATGGGSYAYGETVTVTATERENGSGENVFVYWKKGDEIVSFDKTYSFLAWETCTLTPVYAEYRPVTDALRKIIISGDGTDLMAEFIGIGNVKEKGILFDKNKSEDVTFANATHKIAMTSDGNFLSAINDIANGATYTGYAILSDNTVVYDK